MHVREGAMILLHSKPGYTIEETRSSPYELLTFLGASGASGSVFLDDGESSPPGPNKILTLSAKTGEIVIQPKGQQYHVDQKLDIVTILGVSEKPRAVKVNLVSHTDWSYIAAQQKMVVNGLSVDLNNETILEWE